MAGPWMKRLIEFVKTWNVIHKNQKPIWKRWTLYLWHIRHGWNAQFMDLVAYHRYLVIVFCIDIRNIKTPYDPVFLVHPGHQEFDDAKGACVPAQHNSLTAKEIYRKSWKAFAACLDSQFFASHWNLYLYQFWSLWKLPESFASSKCKLLRNMFFCFSLP